MNEYCIIVLEYLISRFDLKLRVIETKDELIFYFDYAADRFERKTINGYARKYQGLLMECLAEEEAQSVQFT